MSNERCINWNENSSISFRICWEFKRLMNEQKRNGSYIDGQLLQSHCKRNIVDNQILVSRFEVVIDLNCGDYFIEIEKYL